MTKGQALRYMLLPGIWPRFRSLFSGGLINIAWLLALIFASVRLLPREHPYLSEANMGRFGIRHVLAEASSRLVFSRNNTDQIVVYFTILTGVVLLCVQFGLLIAAILSQPVLAQTFSDMFMNPSGKYNSYGPEQDIAFVILDKIFGVRGIFNSCISTGAACVDMFGRPISKPSTYPYPMHRAFHELLGYYSLGIGVISLMVIIYQVTTVVGETAATGTPFGRRYNRAWAPVRLIVFFALLAPLNIGGTNAWFNGAQLATLWTAKWGSNVATNGWIYFNSNLSDSYIGKAEELIARPQMPRLAYLTRFYMLVHTCKMAYELKTKTEASGPTTVGAYLIRSNDILGTGGADGVSVLSADFDAALRFSSYGNITIRFGLLEQDSDGKARPDNIYRGKVTPLCGEITLNIGDVTQPGARELAKVYYDLLLEFYSTEASGGTGAMSQIINYYAACNLQKIVQEPFGGCIEGSDYSSSYFATTSNDFVNAVYHERMEAAIQKQIDEGKFDLPEGLKRKGWAAAAILYNTIAEMNGAVTAGLLGSPTIISYPKVMTFVEEANRRRTENIDAAERFDPGGTGENEIKFAKPYEYEIARALNSAYKIFDNNNVDETPQTRLTGNAFIDAINMLFGTRGIYDMLANKNINPLAQLSSLGRSMVEQAIRNFGAAVGVSLGEGLLGLVSGKKISGLDALNNFLETVSTIGILIGFILYYVLPLMPFIYFFFALGGWVKAIFEGIVAMPLWALAHLTIDGQGLPGQNAANGYYLLLEIFARPILIFAGLLGSVTAFSTMVTVLNEVFNVVVMNVSGSDALKPSTPSSIEYYRGPVDEFFFTMLYTIICYMIGLASFKMIDNVPNNILRWMGVSVSTFQESVKNPADQLTGSVYSSGSQVMGQIQSSLTDMKLSGGQLQALIAGGR